MDLNPEVLLAEIRKHLGLVSQTEGVIPHLIGPGVILWLHDRGLLMPQPQLWKLEDNVYAGPAIIHSMHPFSAQFRDSPAEDDVRGRITWNPKVRLDRIQETLRVAQGPQGFLPVVDRSPVFEPVEDAPEEEPAAQVDQGPIQLWTVYRNGEGGFRGIKYEISAAGHSVIDDPVEADDLEVLYALMEVDEDEGDTRHPRDARDAPSIVETWRLKKR